MTTELYENEWLFAEKILLEKAKLEEENQQLKNILTELEEWLCGEKIVVYNVDGKVGILRGDILNKIQELKEKYK